MGKLENAAQDAKGRLKETAGEASGDEQLRDEGRLDQAASAVKGSAEDVKEKVEGVIDAAKDKLAGH